ncbi:hypothetical protein [Nocardia flavorosea]|uniref:Uncharacterized protein n=1 Tax=Nocardia flavorosea TaxID=53429 RepID=A0A846YJV9_9NOCA|nr:hypothetical protein [Nocardia flavorosea]NKY59407.1 hypothetical protein [Nocardia flavorosea]
MGSSHSGAIPPDRQSDAEDTVVSYGPEDQAEGVLAHGVAEEEILDLTADGLDEMSFIEAMLARNYMPAPSEDIVEEVISEATDALDEADAEQEMHTLLLDCNVEGPVWEEVVASLSRYTNEVLDVWIRSGAIYSKLTGHYIAVTTSYSQRFRLAVNEDLREEIIAESIAVALEKLQAGIRDGTGWNPALGAKLTTFFLRGCLFAFKRTVEAHLRQDRKRALGSIGAHDVEQPDDRGYPSQYGTGLGIDPAEAVANRDLIRQHLEQLDAHDRQIVWAKAAGYTHAEIAQLFPNKTAKAIERKLARLAANHRWIANLSTRRS